MLPWFSLVLSNARKERTLYGIFRKGIYEMDEKFFICFHFFLFPFHLLIPFLFLNNILAFSFSFFLFIKMKLGYSKYRTFKQNVLFFQESFF